MNNTTPCSKLLDGIQFIIDTLFQRFERKENIGPMLQFLFLRVGELKANDGVARQSLVSILSR